jgi:DNA-binding NarL/FixJ family response regulator
MIGCAPDGHHSLHSITLLWVIMSRRNERARLADMSSMVRIMNTSTLPGQSLHQKRILLARLCKLVGEQAGATKGKLSKEQDLPPRVLQTLEGLLAGQSEKEVAHELGVSPHTVHVYVKSLHKHFGVSSRGELLARFVDDATK